MQQLAASITSVCTSALDYYTALAHFYFRDTSLEDYPHSRLDPASRVWVYSLARTIKLLGVKHYRARSFGDDIRANLRNVAIPGTGVPMHLLFWTSGCAWLFFAVLYPAAALLAAAYLSLAAGSLAPLPQLFREHLLQPRHWFARWRLNSLLVAWHASATATDGSPISKQYALENKGAFLLAARDARIPISPFLDDVGCLFAKHVNMEGGLGIHVLRSFTHGGDWILQRALTNGPELQQLLPPGAPLSTLRVVTTSRRWLLRTAPADPARAAAAAAAAAATAEPAVAPADGSGGANKQRRRRGAKAPRGAAGDGAEARAATAAQDSEAEGAVSALTAVLRAGRAGALTDHDCICFPVDMKTGELLPAKSNQHWYQVGPRHIGRIGPTFGEVFTQHPDQPGSAVKGRHIPGIERICSLCTDAHRRLLPDVPLVGWDVALTAEHGPVLLELNISCNFFLGDVDEAVYLSFMAQHFAALQKCGR